MRAKAVSSVIFVCATARDMRATNIVLSIAQPQLSKLPTICCTRVIPLLSIIGLVLSMGANWIGAPYHISVWQFGECYGLLGRGCWKRWSNAAMYPGIERSQMRLM